MTVPPYAIATSVTVLVAVLSERYKRRAPFIMTTSAVAGIGYIFLLSSPAKKPGLAYFGTILAASGIYPSTGSCLFPVTRI
jgi:MFS transporter, ACS family, DAL5 transporter family protein